jgi:hypothetical protein
VVSKWSGKRWKRSLRICRRVVISRGRSSPSLFCFHQHNRRDRHYHHLHYRPSPQSPRSTVIPSHSHHATRSYDPTSLVWATPNSYLSRALALALALALPPYPSPRPDFRGPIDFRSIDFRRSIPPPTLHSALQFHYSRSLHTRIHGTGTGTGTGRRHVACGMWHCMRHEHDP